MDGSLEGFERDGMKRLKCRSIDKVSRSTRQKEEEVVSNTQPTIPLPGRSPRTPPYRVPTAPCQSNATVFGGLLPVYECAREEAEKLP